MAAPDLDQDGAPDAGCGNDRGDVGVLVLMSLAFAGWVVAFISFGEPGMWFFGALAGLLTMAAMALMRPASQTDSTAGDVRR